MPLKISISWPAGSWKSSVIKEIVARTWFATADVGQIYRKQAAEMGMTISEFNDYLDNNLEEDLNMEKRFQELVENSEKDIIVSWRLWFKFIKDLVSIWLDVSPEEWAKRIMSDTGRGWQEKKNASLEDVIKTNKERMERVKDRLKLLYWVDFMDKSNYTKVIDTTGKSFEEVVEEIMEYIENLR